jgi:hypothetical protein
MYWWTVVACLSCCAYQQLLSSCQQAEGAGDVPVDPQELLTHNIGLHQRRERAHPGDVTEQALCRQQARMKLACRMCAVADAAGMLMMPSMHTSNDAVAGAK